MIGNKIKKKPLKADAFTLIRTFLRKNLVSAKADAFTLIEMLVVTSILGFVVIMGSNLFFSIMRGSNKSEAIKEVKQNGDYAMEIIGRMVRAAKSVQCVGNPSNDLLITTQDNKTFDLKCSKDTVIKIATVSGNIISPLTGNSVTLTENLNQSNCASTITFDCGADSKKVTVSFTLYYYGLSKGAFVDESSRLDFESTFQLRNY